MLQLVTVPGRIRLKLATVSGAKVCYPFVAGSGIGVAAVAATMVASGGAGPRRVETAERQRENGRHPGVSKGRRPTGNTPSPVGRDTAIQSTRERSALRVTYGDRAYADLPTVVEGERASRCCHDRVAAPCWTELPRSRGAIER